MKLRKFSKVYKPKPHSTLYPKDHPQLVPQNQQTADVGVSAALLLRIQLGSEWSVVVETQEG
ncbi:MAG: hypothetical protein RJQ09_21005 [Cyclobacteriaceae bacterium]